MTSLLDTLNSALKELGCDPSRFQFDTHSSVVMGFVGAGGLGQLMDQSMKMLNGGEASTILATFLALVLVADALSGAVRRLLA